MMQLLLEKGANPLVKTRVSILFYVIKIRMLVCVNRMEALFFIGLLLGVVFTSLSSWSISNSILSNLKE